MKNGEITLKLVMLGFMTMILSHGTVAQDRNQVVRIAKIKIDSMQIEKYNASLKEAAETAVRVEPGVLLLYAVHDKNDDTNVTVFEIYADANAYQSHLQTAHFKKYKSSTIQMVKSLELMDVEPIVLSSKKVKQ